MLTSVVQCGVGWTWAHKDRMEGEVGAKCLHTNPLPANGEGEVCVDERGVKRI